MGGSTEQGRRQVSLLGSFEVTVDGAPVTVPVTARRIVAVLALHGRTARSRIAGSLWPDTTQARAQANLRTAVWRANQAAPGLILAEHESLALADGTEIDVTRLVHAAHDVMARGAAVPREPTLHDVTADLLPDWNDEWLTVDRERLRQLRLHLLETWAAQLADREMYGMAMEMAMTAVRADALRESAHRVVIRIHLAEGNVAEALHAYRHCSALLEREFGLAPSRETAELVREFVGLQPLQPLQPLLS